MIRISALGSDEENSASQSVSSIKSPAITKEAQESELFSLYNRALELLKHDDAQEAKTLLLRVLQHPIAKQLEQSEVQEEGQSAVQLLLYSTHKNLASLYQQSGELDPALGSYIQAVEIDGSDVTVWYKIGQLSLSLHNFALARHAFQQGLECNERHWPCLENIITLMYATANYHGCLGYIAQALERDPGYVKGCLGYIAQALERDPGYVKGLALMQRIYAEYPSIQRDTMHLFHECDSSIFDTEIPDEEAGEYVSEALVIRRAKQESEKPVKLPLAHFAKALTKYTWQDLGERLLALYEHMDLADKTRQDRSLSIFGCKVDLSPYQNLEPSEPSSISVPEIQVTHPELAEPNEKETQATTSTTEQILENPKETDSLTNKKIGPMTSPVALTPVSIATPYSAFASPLLGANLDARVLGLDMNSPLLSSNPSSLLSGASPALSGVSNLLDTPSVASSLPSEPNTPLLGTENLLQSEALPDRTGAGSDQEIVDVLNVKDPELKGSFVQQDMAAYSGGSTGSALGRAGLKRKRPKRDDDMLYGGKRRSSRVRNVVRKKEEEVINYQELLTKFLPSSLVYGRADEDKETAGDTEESMDTQSSSIATETAPLATHVTPEQHLAHCEREQVRAFIARWQQNSGVIELLGEWCMALAEFGLLKWPQDLRNLYVKCYERTRKHMEYPDYLCKDYPDERISSMAHMCLVYTEIRVDRWLNERASLTAVTSQSPLRSPVAKLKTLLDSEPEVFSADVLYLVGLSCLRDVIGADWRSFCVRLFMVRAKLMVLQNNMDIAIDSYYTTLDYLQGKEEMEETTTDNSITVHLPNNLCDPLISAELVEREIASLERCQSLEEVHRLHEAGEYDRVVTLLLDSFKQARPVVEVVERHEQLLLLQDCLLALEDHTRCLHWAEVSLNEAWRRYQSASKKAAKQEWAGTMRKLMQGLDKCLRRDGMAVDSLASKNLVRLTGNLVCLAEACLEAAETGAAWPVMTHLHWCLLYRLMRHEERRMNIATDDLPASAMLLNFAHECLGRRSLCVSHEGSLLLFTVQEFMGELQRLPADDHTRADLEMAIGQCFYCLYGYPHKKTKAKHLQDHNVGQLELTWERAGVMFDYFKPKSLPEFDSVRTNTVSAELENLLRRIVEVIPQDNYSGNTVESVMAYIEGTTSQEPALPEGKRIQVPVVTEIYYLLADYYFKNKEQGKAIKFYIHDLCLNPTRFDSWAGMALARSSRLEQRLNSHELKNDPCTVQKQAHSALRCFVRALSIDSGNAKLWIEHGSLAYQLHAYLSRTLKQVSMFPLAEDALQLTRRNKAEMLRTAYTSYSRAHACDEALEEEPWLQHYMLGKIAEKMRQPPPVCLQHYKMAAHYLHEERAKYPKRITYILSPPALSVEAVEVFYRLHVCTIKFLLRNEKAILAMENETKSITDQPASKKPEDNPNANTDDVKKQIESKEKLDDSNQTLQPSGDQDEKNIESKPDDATVIDIKLKSCEEKMDTSEKVTTDLIPRESDVKSRNKEHGFYLGLLKEYVEDSLKTPFALGQEKEKPKLKITDRSEMTSPVPGAAPTTVKTPTRASRLDHTYSSCSVSRHPLASATSTAQESAQSPSTVQVENKSPSKADPVSEESMDTSVFETPPAATTVTEAKKTPQGPASPRSSIYALGASSVSTPLVTTAGTDTEPSTRPSTLVPKSLSQIHEESDKESPTPESCLKSTNTERHGDKESNKASDSKIQPPSLSSDINEGENLAEDKRSDLIREGSFGFKTPSLETNPEQESKPSNPPEVVGKPRLSFSVDSILDLPPEEDKSCKAEEKDNESASLSTAKKLEPSLESLENPLETSHDVKNKEPKESDAGLEPRNEDNMNTSADSSHNSLQSALNMDISEPLSSLDSTLTLNQTMDASAATVKCEEPDAKETNMDDSHNTSVAMDTSAMDTSHEGEAEFAALEAIEKLSRAMQSANEEPAPMTPHSADDGENKKSQDISKEQPLNSPVREGVYNKKEGGEVTHSEASNEPESKSEVAQPSNESEASSNVESKPVASTDSDSKPSKESRDELDSLQAFITQLDESIREQKQDPVSTEPKEETRPATEELDMNTTSSAVAKMEVEQPTTRDEASAHKRGVDDKEIDLLDKNGKEKPSDETQAKAKDLESSAQNVSHETKNEEKMDSTERKEAGQSSKSKEDSHNKEDAMSKEPKTTDAVSNVKDDDANKTAEVSEAMSSKDLYKYILEKSMSALALALGRFPQHYKALYRLALIYLRSELFKDVSKARDILLGNKEKNWQDLSHMPCPGLFQERKNANFFQGLWRIPVEDIDRSGSFATHMTKCVYLVYEVLHKVLDHKTLYSMHVQLTRTPDIGKKYLRENERSMLARLAFDHCFDVIADWLPIIRLSDDVTEKQKFLLDVHRFWQHGVRHQLSVKRINTVFTDVYLACAENVTPSETMTPLEQAMKYCQQVAQQIAQQKAAQAAAARTSEAATSSTSTGPLTTSTTNTTEASTTSVLQASPTHRLGKPTAADVDLNRSSFLSPSTSQASSLGSLADLEPGEQVYSSYTDKSTTPKQRGLGRQNSLPMIDTEYSRSGGDKRPAGVMAVGMEPVADPNKPFNNKAAEISQLLRYAAAVRPTHSALMPPSQLLHSPPAHTRVTSQFSPTYSAAAAVAAQHKLMTSPKHVSPTAGSNTAEARVQNALMSAIAQALSPRAGSASSSTKSTQQKNPHTSPIRQQLQFGSQGSPPKLPGILPVQQQVSHDGSPPKVTSAAPVKSHANYEQLLREMMKVQPLEKHTKSSAGSSVTSSRLVAGTKVLQSSPSTSAHVISTGQSKSATQVSQSQQYRQASHKQSKEFASKQRTPLFHGQPQSYPRTGSTSTVTHGNQSDSDDVIILSSSGDEDVL